MPKHPFTFAASFTNGIYKLHFILFTIWFVDFLMNVPAWVFPNLCIGRSCDANDNNTAGVDLFQPDIHFKTQDLNTSSLRYKIIKSNEDVRDLLNISGEISLKIKANILKVKGPGTFLSLKKEEGTTEILVVMKHKTVRYSDL